MASAGKTSSTDVAALTQRIKELEKQVSDYKRRLDELRKAKSTTLVKTQKEMVEMNTPNLGVRPSSDDNKLQKLQRQLEEQEKRHAAEINKYKGNKSETACGHEEELLSLRGENGALLVHNEQLQERVTSLVNQLSLKEAQTCEKEEQYKIEVKKEWGDKYKEWMAQTEQKLEELQHTNALLQSYLKKSGHMPSEGDGS